MKPQLHLLISDPSDIDADAELGWYDDDGDWQQDALTLSDVAPRLDRHTEREIIVWVPGSEIGSTHLTIPTQSQRKAQKSVPWVLEAQLGESVDATHIAITPLGNDRWHVLYLRQTKLRDWLDALEEMGIRPTRILPMHSALEEGELLHVAGWVACRHNGASAMFDADAWNNVTETAFPEISESNPTALNDSDVLRWLVDRYCNRTFPNLLTGAFRPADSSDLGWLKAARPAVFVANACLLLLAIYLSVSGWLIGNRAEAVAKDLKEVYETAFPGEPIVDLRRQVEGKLRLSGGLPSESSFIELVDALAVAMNEVGEIRLERLRYEDKQNLLNVGLQSPSIALVNQLKTAVDASGLSATVVSMSENSAGITASLEVRAAVKQAAQGST